MRVFVAGATGVLGQALLPQLAAAGIEAIGLARTPEKLLLVDKLGGRPVRGDVLDASAMRKIITETQPDAIVNLATAIPLRLKINPKDWEQNDRVRLEGTRHLLAAAQGTSLRLFVQESVGYVCASQGADWIDEQTPYAETPFTQATIQMEREVVKSGLPATTLRLSALLSPASWHTQQTVLALHRGLLPIIGDGAFYVSQIHAEDAAQAIRCALASPERAAGQTYQVTDNEPVMMQEFLPYAAQLLGANPPRKAPPFLAKMIAGALTVELFTASYRIRNAKIRQELHFTPQYPTYRESWAQIAQEVAAHHVAPSDDLK